MSFRKTITGVFSGSILQQDWMRRTWPYLVVLAVVLVFYVAHTFRLQQLYLQRQALERQVRELGIEAVHRTAERVRETRRSAIVKRLGEKNIPLKEFANPVKTIREK